MAKQKPLLKISAKTRKKLSQPIDDYNVDNLTLGDPEKILLPQDENVEPAWLINECKD